MPFAVRLLNNDHTPMELVVSVLTQVFGKSQHEAVEIMLAIHNHGSMICETDELDEAMAKLARVAAFAAEHWVPLACAIEPAIDPKAATVPGVEMTLVPVGNDVEIDVWDWGGDGPALIFLAGLGNDASSFDVFARKFTATNRVYGLTRRGFGRSSKPPPTEANYAADRLGQDIVAVMEALGIERAALVGHSYGGAEMSWMSNRHPARVTGLVYLDAGYYYALWTEASRYHGMLHRIQDRLNARWSRFLPTMPEELGVGGAIMKGGLKYTGLQVPVLAIFAIPGALQPAGSESRGTEAIANAFADAAPSARVVCLPNAHHGVFNSNEAEVFGEMQAFIGGLH